MTVTIESNTSAMRFAFYFAPKPGTPLHQLGAAWLGRDADAHTATPQVHAETIARFTGDARRYGFHGTLKPPFALKNPNTATALKLAARDVLADVESFSTGKLELRDVDGFLALVPDEPLDQLNHLAAHLVKRLDQFRQPPSESELARRRAAGLTPQQESNLATWGYPYVLDEFRFHLTLTRRLSENERNLVLPLARSHFMPVIGAPLVVSDVALFNELEPGSDFQVVERLPLVPSNRFRAAS